MSIRYLGLNMREWQSVDWLVQRVGLHFKYFDFISLAMCAWIDGVAFGDGLWFLPQRTQLVNVQYEVVWPNTYSWKFRHCSSRGVYEVLQSWIWYRKWIMDVISTFFSEFILNQVYKKRGSDIFVCRCLYSLVAEPIERVFL